MAASKKVQKKRAHHISTSTDTPITIQPIIADAPHTKHAHKKNFKSRVIVNVWSHRWTGYYETEWCVDCTVDRIEVDLLAFLKADVSQFSTIKSLVFIGANGDNANENYSAQRKLDLESLRSLVKPRNDLGGKITLRIARKSKPLVFYIVVFIFIVVVGALVAAAFGGKDEPAKGAFFGLLGNLLSGFL